LAPALAHRIFVPVKKKEILLPTDQGHNRIRTSDIPFVEAYVRGTRFYHTDSVLTYSTKVRDALALLSPT
jgi:hypothetical protein